MKQTWKKLGRIFDPASATLSYASVPIAVTSAPDHLKIYFSSRDKLGRSLVHFAYFGTDLKLLKLEKTPLLTPGNPGFFDEDGAMATEIITLNEKKLLYYIGWSKSISVPFRNAIGLAIADKDGDFKKVSTGPVLDRSIYDPCFVASCSVMFENNIFRMWYLSCFSWKNISGKLVPYYHIKYAESHDGISWKREGEVAIDFAYENEYAISVPRIIKEDGIYKAWYSYRGGPFGDTYRIGYAESSDGKKFERKDFDINLEPGKDSWDSEMICYPYIFDWNGSRYMLYNGNGYGRSGFGIAMLE